MSDKAASAPPVTADPQDPLPESKWIWRRILTFFWSSFAAMVISAAVRIIARLGERAPEAAIDGLVAIVTAVLIFSGVVVMLYLVAPSAEQLGKIGQMISAMKAGVTFRTRARAVTSEGSAETSTIAGQPAQPVDPNK